MKFFKINIFGLQLNFRTSTIILGVIFSIISGFFYSNSVQFNINNVIQLYGDSTKFDFSKIDFSMALIDGGHDYHTVKSDTLNLIRYIKKPGWIFWHDYDVINDVGKCLTEISNKLKIDWIKNTRLCFSYIVKKVNL